MQQADRLMASNGTQTFMLIERAGAAVANFLKEKAPGRKILILCGPGNNGGDGFVAARLLREAGFAVRVASLMPPEKLAGDAAWAAESWQRSIVAFDNLVVEPDELVVDAVFGTGFNRKLDEPVQSLFRHIREQGNDVLAIDSPSGVNGTTGHADPDVLPAAATLTFCRKKPGLVLMPGAAFCGEVHVADIGIPDTILAELGPAPRENGPVLWSARLRPKAAGGNKYDYGHVLVYGGARMTGAACMAAHAALRAGAGLCTISSPPEAARVYRGYLPNIIVEERARPHAFTGELADKRRNAVIVGPGAGRDHESALRDTVIDLLKDRRACVIDADALTVFKDHREPFFKVLHGQCVLTPHDGEFARIFPELKDGPKTERAAAAARQSKAVIVLKGADTVIAGPDGTLVINTTSSPDLATGGTGDVLAGLIGGLLARGLPAFDAACAGVWLQGRAAQMFGTGLIATDLLDKIPLALREIA